MNAAIKPDMHGLAAAADTLLDMIQEPETIEPVLLNSLAPAVRLPIAA
jgi:hypothetical protein